MDEQSIFQQALDQASDEERSAWLDEVCGSDAALRKRIEILLASHEQAGSFLETPAAEFEATIIHQAMGADRAQSLQAGLAVAFGEDQAVVLGDGNHSVLKMLGRTLDRVPRVALRDPVAEGADPIVRPKSAEMPTGNSDSRYQLQGEIARGGMGAILKGRDTDLGRDLAIKVLLDAHKDKPEVVQRFIEEAQIGGQLQHPGIAPIYELGQFADKRPFFAMKLVKGETLSKLLADRKEAVAERGKFIGIFEQICQTMAYAHSRGVIHRDLKPANIMVGAFGEVQVMDWGLAKVLQAGGVADEKAAHDKQQGQSIIQTLRSKVGSDVEGALGSVGSQTQMGSVMGTPAYMPPEQALGEIDQMDERADVFGLGAILCEILTGKPPYVGDDGTHVFRQASRGKLKNCFARLAACGADEELIAIAKHCLELEPSDRPRDASVLAERVATHLASAESRLRAAEVDRAAEAARAEQALHTAKEHAAAARAERRARRLQLGMAVVVLCVTTIGGIAAAWTAMVQSQLKNDAILAERMADSAREQETTQRKLAEVETTRAEAQTRRAESEKIRSDNMLADMQTERGLRAGREGHSATAALWFANAAALTPHDVDRLRANHLRAASWINEAMVPAALLKTADVNLKRLSFQPGGALMLTVSGKEFRVWDWRNGIPLPWSEALTSVIEAVWSPDGRQLAVGLGTGDVQIFEPLSGTELKRFRHSDHVDVLMWSPDGTRLVAGGARVQVWNVSAEPVRESDWAHPKRVFGLNFNRAGTRLVTACEDQLARVFAVGDAAAQQSGDGSVPLMQVEHLPGRIIDSFVTPVFCDDDRKLTTILKNSKQPMFWDLATGQRVDFGWKVSSATDRTLDVSPDGKWVAAGGLFHCLLLRVDGSIIRLDHANHVNAATFHPNGQSLLTTCIDGTTRLWPLRDMSRSVVGTPIGIPQPGSFASGVFSPDGSSLAIAAYRQVVIWERQQSQSIVGQIAWADSFWRPRPSFDRQLVTRGVFHEYSSDLFPRGNTLTVARMADGQPAGPLIPLDGLLFDSCVCSDNRSVAAATAKGKTGLLSVFDVASGKEVIPQVTLPDLPASIAARPGHPQLAVLCKNGKLIVIDTQNGSALLNLSHDKASAAATFARTAYSPDGAALVTTLSNNLVTVRDAQSGELRCPSFNPVLEGGPLRSITFSPDSRLLATAACGKNMAQVWDLATGAKVGREMPHPGDHFGLWSVAFSPDGKRLLTAHKDGRVRLFDWQTGQLVGAPMQHSDDVNEARFTADGRHVLTSVRQ